MDITQTDPNGSRDGSPQLNTYEQPAQTIPFFPPVHQNVEGAALYACAPVVDSLFIRILDAFEAARNRETRQYLRSNKKDPSQDPYTQAWGRFQLANYYLAQYQDAAKGLHAPPTEQPTHAKEAASSLGEARAFFPDPHKQGAPVFLKALDEALKALQQELASPASLMFPEGTDISPARFCQSLAHRLATCQFVLAQVPRDTTGLASFKTKVGPLLEKWAKEATQAGQDKQVSVAIANSTVANFEALFNHYLDLVGPPSNDEERNFNLALLDAVMRAGLSECRRFQYCHQAQNKGITGQGIGDLCQLIITDTKEMLRTLQAQHPAPELEEKDRPFKELWEAVDQQYQDSYQTVLAELEATSVQLVAYPITSNLPAVIGSYYFAIDNHFGPVAESWRHLHLFQQHWETEAASSESSPWGNWVKKRIEMYKKAMIHLSELIADPLFYVEAARKSGKLSKKPASSTSKKKKKKTKTKTKAIATEIASQAKELSCLQPLLDQAHRLVNHPVDTPQFDRDFREEWRVRSVASLKNALYRLVTLEKRGFSYDSIWATLQQLHTLLEAVLDRILVHYPLGRGNTHSLNLQGADRKPLKQQHDLRKLQSALIDGGNQVPVAMQNLISQHDDLMRQLSRVNEIATYPKTFHNNLQQDERAIFNPLLQVVDQLEKEITPEAQANFVDNYIVPTLRFVLSATCVLMEQPIPQKTKVSWTDKPFVQLDPPKISKRGMIENSQQHIKQIRVKAPCGAATQKQRQLRNEALAHCSIYYRRLMERLGEDPLDGVSLLTLLELSHQLLKELYVAAIANQAGGEGALLVPIQGSKPLRFEHSLTVLHNRLETKGQVKDPNQLSWPPNAHYLLTYSFALKKIGDEATSEKEKGLRAHLEKLYQKDGQGSPEIQTTLLNEYVFPSLEAAALLLDKGFSF